MKEQGSVPLENINLRLRKRMHKIRTLFGEIQEILDLIPAPTSEELGEMVRGKRPLTLETLMIGAMELASYHLSEARVIIDRYGPYTTKAFAQANHFFWRDDLVQSIRQVVEARARVSLGSEEVSAD